MTVVTVVTGKQHSQLKDNLLAVYPAMNCLSHPRHLRPNHVGYEVLVQQRLARCPQTFIGRNYIRARCDSNGPSASTASSTNIGSTIAAQGGSSLKDATRTTSAKDKLDMLQQMQARSNAALKDLNSTHGASAPRLVDARMYTASLEAQRRQSEKLSEANSYILYLQDQLQQLRDDLEAAAEIFKKVNMEFGTTGRLAESAMAAVKFGVDKEAAIVRVGKLRERLHTLEVAMTKEMEEFGLRVPRKVPVTWVGNASEVKLVGDFDQWSRGVDLSGTDVDSDSVLRAFEATVSLLPGAYRVKFMVDGEWRLAPDWPTENNDIGETNNVLTVQ